MELPLGNKTIIQWAVESMYEVMEQILVVVGWNADRVQKLLAGYEKVNYIENPDYHAGMFSSVQAGIAAVRAPRFFLLPGDMPLVSKQTYRRLLLAQNNICIPVHQGRKGHPVLMSSRLIPQILNAPPTHNLRDFIASKGFSCVEVDDQGIVADVDTPDDYRMAISQWEDSQSKSRT